MEIVKRGTRMRESEEKNEIGESCRNGGRGIKKVRVGKRGVEERSESFSPLLMLG